ncbi:MAG: dihydrodiol dehydrogenase [Thermomicrobium sp.]|uniref:dihydrodiol dehydrogenase n=1 Tax=Thermomicrobium sp. TaxID=1969469 RepID=UPI001B0F6AD5|nr:dihydrodiol dehydrogenase [Thermomicrobium sp.]MBO9351799.1 dihydrodiol dehydrogenase [Thermomicrobium sp.]
MSHEIHDSHDRITQGVEVASETIVIKNEFAEAHVRKVRTRNGERLEIHSPKLGYTIRLDPLELEAISWQPVDTFSRMLENPWGPA